MAGYPRRAPIKLVSTTSIRACGQAKATVRPIYSFRSLHNMSATERYAASEGFAGSSTTPYDWSGQRKALADLLWSVFAVGAVRILTFRSGQEDRTCSYVSPPHDQEAFLMFSRSCAMGSCSLENDYTTQPPRGE